MVGGGFYLERSSQLFTQNQSQQKNEIHKKDLQSIAISGIFRPNKQTIKRF